MAENTKKWEEAGRRYRTYIKLEKRLSKNTVESYMRDLRQFAHFILRQWDVAPHKVEEAMIERYMAWLYDRGCEKSSQARALSGLKSFFNYLLLTDAIESSPLEFIEMPKFSRRLPDVLSTAEIDRILAAIDRTTPKGVRDDAMLELLYYKDGVFVMKGLQPFGSWGGKTSEGVYKDFCRVVGHIATDKATVDKYLSYISYEQYKAENPDKF